MKSDQSTNEGELGEVEASAVLGAMIDRRTLLKRSVIGGVAISGLSAILAACGGEEEAAPPAAEPTPAPAPEPAPEPAPAEPEAPPPPAPPEEPAATPPPPAAEPVDFGPADKLDTFKWSFAIPKEDSENTAYYVNQYIFGPNEGIELEMNSGTSTSDFIKLVADHEYNAAHPSVFLMALMKDAGLPVQVYFDNMNINIFGWAVPESSPIQAPVDMEGKKVAIAVVGWDALWNPIVAAAGSDWSKIQYEVVGLGTPARLNALYGEKVDVIVTWNGEYPIFATEAELAGNEPLRFISGEEWFKTPANGWAAALDRLEPDRDLLVRAARAQARAMYFVRENPTESAKIFHHYYPDVHTAPEQAETIAKDYNETGFTAATEANGLGYNEAERWQTLLDSMYEFKLTKNQLKAEDMFTNDLIAEINDFDPEEVKAFARSYVFEES
jgi:ABC-type nitrate/sulfonate/bicarbonate transport system substrate-binding protein